MQPKAKHAFLSISLSVILSVCVSSARAEELKSWSRGESLTWGLGAIGLGAAGVYLGHNMFTKSEASPIGLLVLIAGSGLTLFGLGLTYKAVAGPGVDRDWDIKEDPEARTLWFQKTFALTPGTSLGRPYGYPQFRFEVEATFPSTNFN